MQGRVVADHPCTERLQQLRHGPGGRPHADQADGGAAQLAAHQQAFGVDHRHTPQHLQQRADHEFSLGLGGGIAGPHHFDARACASLEVDILGARRQAAHRPQQRRTGQRIGIERDGGRDDQGLHMAQRLAQATRVTRQIGCKAHRMPRQQPLHHVRVEGLDDQHHGAALMPWPKICVPESTCSFTTTSHSMLVKKAIFPVAGLGTRFLPATKAQPKEMLPVVDKPLIQYAVEEAYAAGVREMIFVTGRHKRPIEDHFDMTFELEVALEQAGKAELLRVVRSVKPHDMECIYVRQPQALGLGHAVLCGQRLVGNEPFAVLLADDLMVGEPPVLQQMVAQFDEWRASILAVQEVPAEHTRRYGIVDGVPVNDRLVDINRIVEKPAPEDAPSRLGVAGRYILTPGVFHEIASQPRGVGGEIQLTDGIASLLRREKVFAYRYQGQRYDCGSKEGWLQANVELALRHPEVGANFRSYLQGLEI